MQVEVVYLLPDDQTVAALELIDGATVADALAAVAEIEPFASLALDQLPVGVYGQRVDRDRVLQSGDRVELYRPLLIDPREARRKRI